MIVTIRKLQEKDKNFILKLGNNFNLTPYVIDKKFRSLTKQRIPILINNHFNSSKVVTIVACINNEVVGFISYILEKELSTFLKNNDNNSPNCASILFVTVDKAYRRKGIAKALIKYAIEKCKKSNVSIIRLGTDFGNNDAVSLYQQMGFNIILTWHIYRIYKNELISSSHEFTPIKKTPLIESIDKFLLRRPFPWFYEPTISLQHTQKFLTNKVKNQLKNNSLKMIQGQHKDKKVGLTFKRDTCRESYYKLNGSLWTIGDFLENGARGELLPFYIQNVLCQLPNFLMAESWVCAHDYETQHILQKAGMKFVYGGISLRKELT